MAENTGAWSQDILTRIYNVEWGGLAVEFGDKDKDADAPPVSKTP